MLGNVACHFKKIPTLTQDLSRRCIATRGGDHLHTLEDRKEEAFINVVDVVVHLHDPSRSSTGSTTPPCSAHVQHDDVAQALDPVEDEGEFHQHDGVATVMMKLPAQGFA